MTKYKIGVYGSAIDEGQTTKQKAIQLAYALAKHKGRITIITGAGHGVPYIVSSAGAKEGVEVWGYPPVPNEEKLKKYMPEADLSVYKKIIYIPKSFPLKRSVASCRVYRNFTSTSAADAGIIISGRWGTMNEFTNLYSMGKVIGILKGTGGIADEMSSLVAKINKPSEAKVIISEDPYDLVEKIIAELTIIKP